MSIFPLDITRFPDFITVYLLRWKRHYIGAPPPFIGGRQMEWLSWTGLA
jgi:hypothetical protein